MADRDGGRRDPTVYVSILADFDGSQTQVDNEGTRIIYDPNSGKLWSDTDGDGGSNVAVHFATVLNHDSITIGQETFPNPNM